MFIFIVIGLSGCNDIKKDENIQVSISTFKVEPAIIESGNSTILSWVVINAQTIFIDNGIGNVSSIGEISIKPSETTTYTIKAKNNSETMTATTKIVVNEIDINTSSENEYFIYLDFYTDSTCHECKEEYDFVQSNFINNTIYKEYLKVNFKIINENESAYKEWENITDPLFNYPIIVLRADDFISEPIDKLNMNVDTINSIIENIQNNDTENNDTSSENLYGSIVTSMGIIKIELFKDMAPNTVDNFIDYANSGFYDGLIFHRVIDDFMIQGGGYYPNGTKKDTHDPIDLEIHEDARHVDAAIAMARTNDPNSATSQFYICDGPQSSLDDNYAVFGIVTEGIDILRSIASVNTTTKNMMQNWPVEDVIINSIRIRI